MTTTFLNSDSKLITRNVRISTYVERDEGRSTLNVSLVVYDVQGVPPPVTASSHHNRGMKVQAFRLRIGTGIPGGGWNFFTNAATPTYDSMRDAKVGCMAELQAFANKWQALIDVKLAEQATGTEHEACLKAAGWI